MSVDTQNITSVCWVWCKRKRQSVRFKNKGVTRIWRKKYQTSKSISQMVAVVNRVWVLTVYSLGVPLVTGSDRQWVETQHRSLLQITSQTKTWTRDRVTWNGLDHGRRTEKRGLPRTLEDPGLLWVTDPQTRWKTKEFPRIDSTILQDVVRKTVTVGG